MSNTIWAVDGSFFAQRLSGIQRYSIELLAALDRIVPPGFVEIVTPPGVETPHYTNIKVVSFGTHRGGVWQQLDYPRYLRQRGAGGLATCNVIPLFGFRGIAVVHDVCYRARPDFYTDPRGRLSAAWHCLQYRRIAKRAERIITVSEFSKSEIAKYYGVPASKMDVVYNAWQQMQRIAPDESIFARHPQLKPGQYYFSMANLLKNKNFPWVLRAAGAKPDAVFAIAGGGSLAAEAERLGLADLPNVLYLGYVSDGAAKALMAHCKAFLFPTLYEGFGIPPLEAAACGAPQIIVSDTPCMREVYGPCAAYIDLTANPGDAVFAIAGGGSLAAEAERLGLADLPNVLYLGYVSDGAAKALMAHCKAFLFPTLYEGFGIPPLEAAACGAPQIIVSDTPCMREVYGPCAAYIDLTANPGDVDDVTPATAPTAALLEKYSWDKSAERLLQILEK